jgi:hypothetical protein
VDARVKAGLSIALADEKAERCNRNHRERIDELQSLPLVGARLVIGVELADGVPTQIAHKLGRRKVGVLSCVPRGAVSAGSISEVDGQAPEKYVTLQADGYGATIRVDLVVF